MTGKVAVVQRDTSIHVAQFLQESVGATRQVRVLLDHLALDDEVNAHQIMADLRLIRIPTGILVKGPVTATLALQCIRCLEEFEQGVEAEVADEYRPTVDVVTGVELSATGDPDAEEEVFAISGLHLLDVAESLRQGLVLAMPMAPLCREDCPGLPEADDLLNAGDGRLAILGQLLDGDSAEAGTSNDQPLRQPGRSRPRRRAH